MDYILNLRLPVSSLVLSLVVVSELSIDRGFSGCDSNSYLCRLGHLQGGIISWKIQRFIRKTEL